MKISSAKLKSNYEFAKISSAKYFQKCVFFQNTRTFSTVEKISLFFSENMRFSIITTKNYILAF